MVSTLNEYLIFTNGQLYIMTRIVHCVNKMSRDIYIYVMVFYTVSEEMPNFDSWFLFIYFVFLEFVRKENSINVNRTILL